MRPTRAWLWALVAAYASLIFYLSSLSHPVPWITHHFWDKSLHFAEYAGLGLLLSLALVETTALRRLAMVLVAAALATFYGATDEFHQHFVPARTADWHDLVADCLGGTAGALLGLAIFSWFLAPRARGADVG